MVKMGRPPGATPAVPSKGALRTQSSAQLLQADEVLKCTLLKLQQACLDDTLSCTRRSR